MSCFLALEPAITPTRYVWGTATACNCAPTKMQLLCMYLPSLPIIPIPQPSKSNYPVSSCCAHNALTRSSHLPPPPADLLSFTKISCNLPLAPDLWQDLALPWHLQLPAQFSSCLFSWEQASWRFWTEYISSASWGSGYLMLLLQNKSRFCCSTSALLFIPVQKQIYRVSYGL